MNFIDIIDKKELVPAKEEVGMEDECLEASQEESWRATYEKKVLGKIRREELNARPILRFMHAIQFPSFSRGRGRARRKYPRQIVLLQYGEDRNAGRWRFWSGEDRTDEGRNPWDKWVTEIYGLGFCDRLSEAGIHPDDYLRNQVVQLLQECGGEF